MEINRIKKNNTICWSRVYHASELAAASFCLGYSWYFNSPSILIILMRTKRPLRLTPVSPFL